MSRILTCYKKNCNHVRIPIAVDVTKEIIKNVTMTVPVVQRYRLNRPRAGVYFTGQDSELRRYAFQGLDTLRHISGGLQGVHLFDRYQYLLISG